MKGGGTDFNRFRCLTGRLDYVPRTECRMAFVVDIDNSTFDPWMKSS